MTDNELLEDLIKKTTVPRINFPSFKGQKNTLKDTETLFSFNSNYGICDTILLIF